MLFAYGFIAGMVVARLIAILTPDFKDDEMWQAMVYSHGYEDGRNGREPMRHVK